MSINAESIISRLRIKTVLCDFDICTMRECCRLKPNSKITGWRLLFFNLRILRHGASALELLHHSSDYLNSITSYMKSTFINIAFSLCPKDYGRLKHLYVVMHLLMFS